MNIRTVEEAYLTDIAIKTVSGLVKKGYGWLKGDTTPYHVELIKALNASIDLYKQQYEVAGGTEISFVDAEVFIEEMVNYQFDLPIDEAKLRTAIKNDPRIQVPTDKEIGHFLTLFNTQISLSKKIKHLYIENNYKEITFRNACGIESLNQKFDELITEVKANVKSLEIEQVLAKEWEQELEAIKQLLYEFKPFTAIDLINKLKERIENRNIKNELLESQLTFLLADATSNIDNFAITQDAGSLFVKAYRLSPNNIEYKRYAALGYTALQEDAKSLTLADEILNIDEFDLIAWTVKLHYSDDPVNFLKQVPKALFSKREFKLNAFFTLAKNRENMRSIFIPESLVKIDLINDELPTLSYSNFKFWLRYSDYLFSRIYFEFPMITNYAESEELKQAPIYQFYFNLLGRLTNILDKSELKKELAYVRFRYHYAKLIMTGERTEIHQLAKIYEEIDEKDYMLVIQLVQAFQLIETEEYRNKSLEVINTFGAWENEMTALFKTVILFNSAKQEEGIDQYEQYILSLTEFSTLLLNNLLQFFRMCYRKRNDRALAFLEKVLQRGVFPNAEMKILLELYVNSIYAPNKTAPTTTSHLFDVVEAGLNPQYPEIREFYLTTLRALKAYERLVCFLRPAPDTSVDTGDLLIYCEALFYVEGNKTELLQALKKARLNLPINARLLRLEIEIRQKQRDWKKVLELAEFAIQRLPPHEDFIFAFFLACLQEFAVDKIVIYKEVVNGIRFSEQGSLIIFSAFSQAGLHSEAIEILYQSAQHICNIASRQTFVASTVRAVDQLFRAYDEVIPDSYVTYKVSGQIFNVFIDPAKLDDISIKPFLGRKVNDHFQLYDNFMQETTFVNIVRITDKYLNLYDEILKQAANPLSGLKVKQFQFDGTTPEEMNRSLQRELGAIGTMDKHYRDQQLQSYNSGQITFSEITKSNFQVNPADAYYVLKEERRVFFQTLPQTIPHEALNANTNFVLDFTGLLLLYELNKEHSIKYSSKFIVSNYVLYKLKHLLNENINEPNDRMSMSITLDSVTPHFFPGDFKERRSAHLQAIINWVEENCIADAVDEKLDVLLRDKENHHNDEYLHYLIDNWLLSLRPDHLLITSDLFYIKVFGGHKRLIGPELYLQRYCSEFDAVAYLLSQNYVGLRITKEHLITEFTAFIAGRPNKYTCAVENLKVNRSGVNLRNLTEGVLFLKWLYLQSLVTAERRYSNAHYLLSNMLQGLSPNGFGMIINFIDKQFALLPMAEKEILSIINEIESRE